MPVILPRNLAIAAVALALNGAAWAQTTPVQPQPRDPNMPAPRSTIPEKIEQGTPGATGSTRSLSDRLERSEGVIRPGPSADDEIVKPAPNVGTTPIIRPPGEPGGDQSLQPK